VCWPDSNGLAVPSSAFIALAFLRHGWTPHRWHLGLTSRQSLATGAHRHFLAAPDLIDGVWAESLLATPTTGRSLCRDAVGFVGRGNWKSGDESVIDLFLIALLLMVILGRTRACFCRRGQ